MLIASQARTATLRIPRPLRGNQSIFESQRRTMGTVRVIVRQDWENGKAYTDDVVDVRAGYARNYLIPQKLAVYATRENFLRFNVPNPDQETAEQRKERLEREASAEDIDLKAHDLLRKYLRNKTLKLWRRVDPDSEANTQGGTRIAPGMVDVKALRDKLSKQLKIDLERHEAIHIHPEPVVFAELSESEIDTIVEAIDTTNAVDTLQIRHLGEYVAKISLRGDYWVPLKFTIVSR